MLTSAELKSVFEQNADLGFCSYIAIILGRDVFRVRMERRNNYSDWELSVNMGMRVSL